MMNRSTSCRQDVKNAPSFKTFHVTTPFAIAAVLFLSTSLAAWWLWPTSAVSPVGTWAVSLPVGQAIALLTTEETPLGEMMSSIGEQTSVTVYCRFFEDDTYALFADADEVIAAAETAVDAVASCMYREGVDRFLDSCRLSDGTFRWLLSTMDVSEADAERAVGDALSAAAVPLFDRLREALAPPEAGTYRYYTDDACVYTEVWRVPDAQSVYVAWRMQDDTLRLTSGTFLDDRLSVLTWRRVDA